MNGCFLFAGPPATVTPPTVTTTIHGVAKDEFGNFLSGVVVSISGKSATTDAQGNYNLPSVIVSPDHCVILSKKNGYFTVAASQTPVANGVTEIPVYMMAASITQSFPSQSGGSVITSKGKVDFAGGIFIKKDGSAYTGQVSVAARDINPDDSNFYQFFNGDPSGNRADGSTTSLVPYGVFRTQINGGSGEELGIAKGNYATLTFALSKDMLANAPNQIALWYFDESSLIWKEEGSALLNGTNYIGTVTHFTDWICADATAATPGYSPNFEFHINLNNTFRISPKGDIIFSFSTSNGADILQLHDVVSGSFLRQLPGSATCAYSFFQSSMDGSRILVGCQGASYWDVSSGSLIKRYSIDTGSSIVMLPDGKNAVYANRFDTEIVLLRLSDSTEVQKLGFSYNKGSVSAPTIVGISSDGSRMLIHQAQNYGLWDINKSTKINTFIITDIADAVIASSDLKTIATSYRGDNYRFYSTATGGQLNSSPFPTCGTEIAFIDNDRFVTVKCDAEKSVGIYSVYSGQLLQKLSIDNNINAAWDFTSSADGSLVGESYTGSSGNKKLWLWKLK